MCIHRQWLNVNFACICQIMVKGLTVRLYMGEIDQDDYKNGAK